MKVESRKRFSTIAIALSVSLVSGLLIRAEEFIEVTVDPPRGPVDGSFDITVRNRTGSVFKLDTCAGPRITSVADGREVYCPPPTLDPCGALPIAPGGTATFGWTPVLGLCEGAPVEPGLYQLEWKGQPEVLPGRVDVLPDAAHELLLRAEPPVARAGETVYITVENTTEITLSFNRCCNAPGILDPMGRSAYCKICLACFVQEELLPGHVRTFEWTAGEDTCGVGESLPGPHRIYWGGFRDAAGGEEGPRYSGVTSILVLPPENRRLDLQLARATAAPDELLEMTAVNPLGVPVYHAFCCDTAIFIDAEGRRSPCTECRLRCAISYGTEIPPGESFKSGFEVPGQAACGLRPGKWSVIWGPNFALDPLNPEPVYGYAELEVVEPGGALRFVRGNCNGSAELDLSDAVFLLTHLFLGGVAPGCPDACDVDDSGELDVTDAVAFLNHLFLGGAAPPPPFPDPGEDPTADRLAACP